MTKRLSAVVSNFGQRLNASDGLNGNDGESQLYEGICDYLASDSAIRKICTLIASVSTDTFTCQYAQGIWIVVFVYKCYRNVLFSY